MRAQVGKWKDLGEQGGKGKGFGVGRGDLEVLAGHPEGEIR